MFNAPLDLKSARILVSNDDGIGAPGIQILEQVAKSLSEDVWVVAPELEQSAASHSLTLRRPLRMREVSPRRFAIDGTPTDCVLMAVRHLLADHKPDLVLSGVNRGGNMGEDVTYSGTIAAAMEGTLLDIPSIAFSQHNADGAATQWDTAQHHAAQVISRLTAVGWPKNVMINVNFPHLPANEVKGIKLGRQGRRKIGDDLTCRRDPRGEPYFWIGNLRDQEASGRGTDLNAVLAGYISVTPLDLDLTHRPTLMRLRQVFDGAPVSAAETRARRRAGETRASRRATLIK